jgi:hypothetical protein
METNNKIEQSQATEQKLVFLNINRHFWSKSGKLILVLDGGTAVAVHPNFMKARLGLQYTPSPRKSNDEAVTKPQVA